MTKGYILQDLDSMHYVVEEYREWDMSIHTLNPGIHNATIFNESNLIFALQKMSQDYKSPCYMKNFLQLTVWTT